jgi:hypothetical protein
MGCRETSALRVLGRRASRFFPVLIALKNIYNFMWARAFAAAPLLFTDGPRSAVVVLSK